MGVEEADYLQNLIETQQTLSTTHERAVQTQVDEWSSIRESDRDALKKYMPDWSSDRQIRVDPLGETVAEAFANFLFGEDPTFTVPKVDDPDADDETLPGTPAPNSDVPSQEANRPAGEQSTDVEPDEETAAFGSIEDSDDEGAGDDQDRLDDLVNANALPTELHEAEKICVSEGEVWWNIYRDDEQSEYPIIEWHSRSHVRPVFRGRRLIAAALVSDLFIETVNEQLITYKYVQIQTQGYIRNLLYRGINQYLGTTIPLSERPETANLQEEWTHELGMLCGRIANRLGKDRRFGISIYQGVKDLLYSLNEATTIGHENARLTLKRRLAVPREAMGADGKFAAGEDILVVDDPLDSELGSSSGSGRFAVLEYSFDAAALIAYKNDLASNILTRVGLSRQFTDPNDSTGTAASGTALRTRLIPTTMSSKGKARAWDDELPRVLTLAQQLDAMPEERGGFGRPWQQAAEPPVIERGDPLPTDETEETGRHTMAVGAEIESRYNAIKELHHDWSDEQINEELDRIVAELTRLASIIPPQAPPAPGDGQALPDMADEGGTGEAQTGEGEPGQQEPGAFAEAPA